jgi:hypothetical protein
MWERLAADPSADYTKELRGATFSAAVGVIACLYFAVEGRLYIAGVFFGFFVIAVQAGRLAAGLNSVHD